MRSALIIAGYAVFLWGLYRFVGWRRAARRYPVVCACGRRIIIGPPVHADNLVHNRLACQPAPEAIP